MNWIARTLSAAALGLAATATIAPSVSIAAEPRLDPRIAGTEGIIGYWKADMKASTYPKNQPVVAIRSFAYTEGGKILVSFASKGTDGKLTFGHWAATPDGTPAIEYHVDANSYPYNVVSWKLVGKGRLELTVARNGSSYICIYQLSDDGQTLNYSYGDTNIVYRRWDLVD